MKKIYFFLLLLISLNARTQNNYYKAYDAGAALSQDTKCVIKTLNGGLAVVTFDSIVHLYRTDINGNIIWKKQFHHNPKYFLPVRVIQDLIDSSFYLSTAYYTNSNLSINKIDKSGNLVWSKTLSLFTGFGIICSSVGGGFALTAGANFDNYLLRFDNGGNIVWQNRYQNSTIGGSFITDIVQCKNNDYVISGSSVNNGADPQIFRVDSSGALKWFNIYDLGPDNEYPYSSAKSDNESILISGTSNNSAYYQSHYIKIDSLGNILNFKKYHSTHDPSYTVILNAGPNRLLMAGSALYPGFKNTQDLYTYMDHTGTVLWNKASGNSLYNSGGADNINSGTTVSPNSFVLGGYGEGKFIAMVDSSGNGFCNSDTIVLKDTTYVIPVLTPTITTGAIFYSPTNNITTVNAPPAVLTSYCNMSVGLNSDPDKKEKMIVYPNPVSPNSQFTLESNLINEHSEMTIHDVLGRSIFRSKLSPGINRFSTEGWKNGIYFFTINNIGRILSTGKIIVAD